MIKGLVILRGAKGKRRLRQGEEEKRRKMLIREKKDY